jgi:hypothetical protein
MLVQLSTLRFIYLDSMGNWEMGNPSFPIFHGGNLTRKNIQQFPCFFVLKPLAVVPIILQGIKLFGYIWVKQNKDMYQPLIIISLG